MRPFFLLLVVGLALSRCGDDSMHVDFVPAAPYTSSVTFYRGDQAEASLYVEIADEPEERARGLMNRESLPEDAGMLFVWTEDTESGFWMRGTLVPLSIAFVRADGTIVHIEDMEPLDETLHYSPEPYRYAIEANQGWFEEQGIEAGDTSELPR